MVDKSHHPELQRRPPRPLLHVQPFLAQEAQEAEWQTLDPRLQLAQKLPDQASPDQYLHPLEPTNVVLRLALHLTHRRRRGHPYEALGMSEQWSLQRLLKCQSVGETKSGEEWEMGDVMDGTFFEGSAYCVHLVQGLNYEGLMKCISVWTLNCFPYWEVIFEVAG